MAKRLLVADDSPTIHKVVQLALAGEGVQVESVDRADAVEDRAADLKPDLVLVDASMPGLTGYEICERLKAKPGLQQTGVVLLIGTGDTFDEGEAARVGCDGHLRKPFDTDELLRAVRRLLHLEAQHLEQASLVSDRTKESFLGSESILDVFGPRTAAPMMQVPRFELPPTLPAAGERPELPAPAPAIQAPHVIPFPGPKTNGAQPAPVELPDEILDAIAARVVRQMSPDVIREVAWEVIPDLAEIVIRQYLEEHGVGR